MYPPPERMTCQQANQLDLVKYLSQIGYEPAKIRGMQYWYHSPLREERTPSFKVDRRLNLWYDHGLGKGGTFIDFALLYHGYSLRQLLQILSCPESFSFHLRLPTIYPVVEPTKGIEVETVNTLTSLSLLHYINKRGIDTAIARNYCAEVQLQLHQKTYSVIGFKNDQGGYELRNPWFKGSTSPKGITTIKQGPQSNHRLLVFEGFFDFLAYQSQHQNRLSSDALYLVVNSLSFFEKCRNLMESYPHIHLYLDRDTSGRNCNAKALAWSARYQDESFFYKDCKDLSEWQEAQVRKKQKRRRFHL